MKVILLTDVKNIGRRTEIKNVSDGYARNFLIPRNLAKPADQSSVNVILKEREISQKKEKEEENIFKEKAQKINGQSFEIKLKAGDKGELFGSVGEEEIKKIITEKTGINIKKVFLEKPIKEIGEYQLKISLTYEIYSEIKLIVSAE